MGMCLESFGKMSVEVRRESFIIHPSYGYKGEGDEEKHDDTTTFGTRWREEPHPEFMLEDLGDLIKALKDARRYLHRNRPETEMKAFLLRSKWKSKLFAGEERWFVPGIGGMYPMQLVDAYCCQKELEDNR
jgi:hypothetical protein